MKTLRSAVEELFAARKCGLSAARWLLAVLQPGRADLIDYLWRLCCCRLPAPTLVAATFLRDAAAAAVGAGGREEHHSCDIPKEWMLRWRGRLRSLNERVFAVLAAPLSLRSSASPAQLQLFCQALQRGLMSLTHSQKKTTENHVAARRCSRSAAVFLPVVRRGSGPSLDSPFALRSAFSLAAAPAPAKAAWSCFTASAHLKAATARTAAARAASRPALALAVGPGAAPSPRQRLRRFSGCSCATSTSTEKTCRTRACTARRRLARRRRGVRRSAETRRKRREDLRQVRRQVLRQLRHRIFSSSPSSSSP